jgi:hypothetical protein
MQQAIGKVRLRGATQADAAPREEAGSVAA